MANSILLTIPSKTFLAGEYLALKGLGAIIFSAKPKFEILISEENIAGAQTQNPFHKESPAGLFWQEQQSFFANFKIQMKPVTTLGGWGASTAEFIGLHALYQLKETLWIEQERIFDLHQMLSDYRRLSGLQTLGFPPSGADLVGQVRGGLTFFEGQNGKIQTFSWPFENLKMKLLTTGIKLPTHEHLKSLQEFPTEKLAAALSLCHEALKAVEETKFIVGIALIGEALQELSLVAPTTQALLTQFKIPGVVAAKGCGALGADVIALFYQQAATGIEIDRIALALGLQVVATESSLCEGLSVHRAQNFNQDNIQNISQNIKITAKQENHS